MSCTGDTSGRPFVEIVWAGGSQAGGRLILHAAELGRWVRRHAALSDAPHAAAQVADAWLARTFETFTDPLRRAAVAAMALDLTRRLKEGTTAETGEHQAALSALYRRLRRTGAYVRSTYDLDLGLVSGLHLPIPPFRVTAPARFHGEAAPLRLRKAAGLGLRLARSHGLPVAADWAHRARLGAWIELHLDLRGAHAFNPQGFATAYRTVAEVLRGRPDLAGVRAGSWLFDPTLARISPELAFVRRSAEEGGARFVAVRTGAEQQAFAAARSPYRRHLIETGAYTPACYTMSWLAGDMIAWSDRTGGSTVPVEQGVQAAWEGVGPGRQGEVEGFAQALAVQA